MKMLIIVPHRKLAFDGESFSKNEQISVKALSGNSDQETSKVNRADICTYMYNNFINVFENHAIPKLTLEKSGNL
jgi:hypothetical protein